MSRRSIAVCFDALGTLIAIRGSMAQQYHTHFCDFLTNHGVRVREQLPSVSEATVGAAAHAALKAHMAAARREWVASTAAATGAAPEDLDPHHAPLGGRTEETMEEFWRGVLNSTYTAPGLYESSTAGAAARVRSLLFAGDAPTEDWSAFLHFMIYDIFRTERAYEWIPDSLDALRRLRTWALERDGRGTYLVEGAPFVLTNSDMGMRDVLRRLTAAQRTEADEARPLIGAIVSAQEVSRAKPSAVGLERLAAEHGLEDMSTCLIHVGDTDDDAEAAAAAGCKFIRCGTNKGVQWSTLLHAIESL